MSKKIIGAVAGLAAATLLVAACGGSTTSSATSSAAAAVSSAAAVASSAAAVASSAAAPASSAAASAAGSAAAGGGKACVILPDAASSARWETADRPFLEEAFKAANLQYDIQNANGDKAKFATIADGFISGGCTVMAIVNLDSPSAAAVIAKADAAGIPVIDYDRLTLGGGAKYYVSFDNVAVGTAIGNGLVNCLGDAGTKKGNVALLNGSPTDNNATLFKQGYNKVLTDAGYTILTSQAVPNWDNTQAGTIFEQIFTKYGTKIQGVASANDGLAGSVAAVLKRNSLTGKVPITGQDATDEGLGRVLTGAQCVTVYKSIKLEAGKAAALAIAMAKGDTAGASAQATASVQDTTLNTKVASVLLTPVGIYKDTVKTVVDDGFTTATALCGQSSAIAKACTAAGIS
jgi:D-xylose transport system substrate-binding protein